MATTYGHCKRGGMTGICVTDADLTILAKALKAKYLNAYIPIPGVSTEDQIKRIKDSKDEDTYENTEYWENVMNGSHGWCNKYTGEVIQWG